MATWHCIEHCGACCHLDPTDRPDLPDYLTPEELELYMSLVGEDGWCIHYDKTSRQCRIYDQRPSFCRVTPEKFTEMYGVIPSEFNQFATECCRQQILGVYGENSPEMRHYEQTLIEESTACPKSFLEAKRLKHR
ncbi:YkgJ family cysteine cluster protein [Spirulina subsalsa]|uniref:YkgJ family cysteine cluster protein n=1 Tax=Spirulina subsalsa TaxID=54311 RepID=UPI0003188493|nr:YkgJ family cysteine cluster protein [Spirulina subsalsa]